MHTLMDTADKHNLYDILGSWGCEDVQNSSWDARIPKGKVLSV